jgi:uncharacterized protein YjbI with pentapeptide repeats
MTGGVVVLVVSAAMAHPRPVAAADAPALQSDSTVLTREQVVARLAAGTTDHPASFAGANLTGLDLSGLDLSRVDFTGATLSRAKFVKAKMFATNFDRAVARMADFSGATMDLSVMRGGTDMSGAILRDVSLFAVIMPGANFTDADLTGARLVASATGAIFVRAKLDHADLGADPRNQPMGVMRNDFTDCDFTGADLSNANLRKAKLIRANFTKANVSGADVTLSDLSGAVFHNITGRETILGLSTAQNVGDAVFDPK